MARKPGSRSRDFDLEPATNKLGPKAVNPHSTWQLLVENQRVATRQSIRAIGALSEIPHGTLYNWIRSRNGVPPRASYTTELNGLLAKALKVSPEELADAYNASAFCPVDPKAVETEVYGTAHVDETPSEFGIEGLKRLLATLRASGRSSFTIVELEVLIQIFALPEPVKH